MAAASKVLTTVGGSAIAATSIGYGIGETTRTKFPTIREHLELSNFKILNPNESEEEWNKISQSLKTPVNDLKERCKDLLETTFWTLDEKYIEASVKCAEEKTFKEVLERTGLIRIKKDNPEHVDRVKRITSKENVQKDERENVEGWFRYCQENDNSSYRSAETHEDFLEKFKVYINDCSFKKDPQEIIKLSYWTEKNLPLSSYIEETTKKLNFIQFEDEKEWKKTLEVSMERENKTPENNPQKLSKKIIQLKWECKRLLNTPVENYTNINDSKEFIFAIENCTKLTKIKEIKWWYSLLTSQDEEKLKNKWDIFKNDSKAKLRAESFGFKSSWETKESSAKELLKICVDKSEEYANFVVRSIEDLTEYWLICTDMGVNQ